MAELRTEFPFLLPKGYVDANGGVHRQGTMRLATARDELEPLGDPKVRDADDPYLTVIVLSRVISGLGPHTRLTPRDVEGLFAADLAYLQDVYSTVNYGTAAEIDRLLTAMQQDPDGHTRLAATAADATAPVDVAATPVSDAARAIISGSAAAQPSEAEQAEPEADDGPGELRTAPRRSRIEEVGRSSGRPGSAGR